MGRLLVLLSSIRLSVSPSVDHGAPPTEGYLLTACFASGRAAGLGALKWMENVETAV